MIELLTPNYIQFIKRPNKISKTIIKYTCTLLYVITFSSKPFYLFIVLYLFIFLRKEKHRQSCFHTGKRAKITPTFTYMVPAPELLAQHSQRITTDEWVWLDVFWNRRAKESNKLNPQQPRCMAWIGLAYGTVKQKRMPWVSMGVSSPNYVFITSGH